MICDQGKNSVSALRNDLKTTKEKLNFEVRERKVYSRIFDVHHIYKNLRKSFKTNIFMLAGNEITFQDIRDVYEIDKKSGTSRTLLKITENYINPRSFQLMLCKLAMQLFSNTMAAPCKHA